MDARTKESRKWLYKWIEHIEKIVSFHTIEKPKISKGKTGQVSRGWIFILLADFLGAYDEGSKKTKNKKGDGVMGISFHLGLILIGWAMRTHLAKCYDPRRPVKARDESYGQYLLHIIDVIQILDICPNELDKKIYKQKWQPTKFIKENESDIVLSIGK
jgi:hypothetical protein